MAVTEKKVVSPDAVKARTKAREMILAALESNPITTDDGERGLYVEIMGADSEISFGTFKRVLGSLVFSDHKVCHLMKDRAGIGQQPTGRMTLTRIHPMH